MDKTRSKIQTSSTFMSVALFLLSFAFGIATIVMACGWLASPEGAFASKETLRAGAFVLQQLLFTVLILYVARMFARISLEETPFFKELSRKIKVAAALLFLAFALPQWAFWVSLCLTGNPTGFVLLNEVSASAFLAAAVVFCLARIFEYGYLVQDENFEII